MSCAQVDNKGLLQSGFSALIQTTSVKSCFVCLGTLLLINLLIHDLYKKRVVRGMTHMYTLAVNWTLYNAIHLKDLNDLVPSLGAAIESCKEQIDIFKKENNTYHAENETHRFQINRLEQLNNQFEQNITRIAQETTNP